MYRNFSNKVIARNLDELVTRDAERINQEEDLRDELGTFRLASVHQNLALSENGGNSVLANLRITFNTTKGRKVKHVIPIMALDGSQNTIVSYNGKQIKAEKEFFSFYKSIISESIKLNRREITPSPRDCYHSEVFLVYYLLSEPGKCFLSKQFELKGLVKLEAERYISNIKEVLDIEMQIHSTKVVCYNCSPFLKEAAPKLSENIYAILAQEQAENKTSIKFIISANSNLNWQNINNETFNFNHIPILENRRQNILTNTSSLLGIQQAFLQTIGEESNRTYFLNGKRVLDTETQQLIASDKKIIGIFKTQFVNKIKHLWKTYKAKLTALKDSLAEIQSKIEETERQKKQLEEKLSKVNKKIGVIDEYKELCEDIDNNGIINDKEHYYNLKDLYERTAELFGYNQPFSGHDNDYEFLAEISNCKKILEERKDKLTKEMEIEEESLAELYEQAESVNSKLISIRNTYRGNRVVEESKVADITESIDSLSLQERNPATRLEETKAESANKENSFVIWFD